MKKSFYITLLTALILCFAVLCCAHAAVSQVLVLPEGTKVIEVEAFYGDTSIREVVLPEGVESIGERAFANSGVTKVNLPESVAYIAPDAFDGCDGVTVIVVAGTPGEEFAIEQGIEYQYELTASPAEDFQYYTTNGQIWITDYHGDGGDVIIPAEIDGMKVAGIEYYAFHSCHSITSITIPNSISHIGSEAFKNCSNLSRVTILGGLSSTGEYSFADCPNLVKVNLPDGLTTIGNGSFSNCKKLVNISFPTSLTKIGYEAFYGCSSLSNVVLPDGIKSIGYRAFCSCSNLSSINLPSSLTTIEYQAFASCDSLTSIDWPDSLTSIDTYMFDSCYSLTSVNLPDTLTRIGSNAFYCCENLIKLDLPDNISEIGYRAFDSYYTQIFCNRHSTTALTLADSNNHVDDCSFFDPEYPQIKLLAIKNVDDSCSFAITDCSDEITDLVVPSFVTSIADSAFHSKNRLQTVTLPEGLTSIGDAAFYQCDDLININLPDSITTIGESAFYGCGGLVHLDLPDNLTCINSEAFAYCTNLCSVHLPGSLLKIDEKAFNQCIALRTIYIPRSVTELVNPFGWNQTTIYGEAGSYAETYATTRSWPFVDINTLSDFSAKIIESIDTAEVGQTLSASVSLANGLAPYTFVYELKKNGNAIRQTLSTSESTSIFTIPSEGDYTVAVTVTDALGFSATAESGVVSVSDPYTVSINGSVVTSNGQALSNVSVYLVDTNNDSHVYYTVSDRNGKWQVRCAKGDAYQILYYHSEYTLSDHENIISATTNTDVGTVAATLYSDIQSDYAPTFTMSTSTTTTGVPVTFNVVCDGSYVVRLVVDGVSYETFHAPDQTCQFQRVFTQSGERSVQIAALRPDGSVHLSDAKLLTVTAIGKLDDPAFKENWFGYAGSPLAIHWQGVENANDYSVYLYHDGLQLWKTTTNGSTSTTIPAAMLYEAGTYTINVLATGINYSQSSSGAFLEVAPPRNEYTISGSFVDEDNNALPDVQVAVITNFGNGTKHLTTVQSDENGSWTVDTLIPNCQYQIVWAKDGYEFKENFIPYTANRRSFAMDTIIGTSLGDGPLYLSEPGLAHWHEAYSEVVYVYAPEAWTVTSDSDWFTIDVADDSFTVSMPANTTTEDRTGEVLVTCGEYQVVLDVLQEAQPMVTSRFSTSYTDGPISKKDAMKLLNFIGGDKTCTKFFLLPYKPNESVADYWHLLIRDKEYDAWTDEKRTQVGNEFVEWAKVRLTLYAAFGDSDIVNSRKEQFMSYALDSVSTKALVEDVFDTTIEEVFEASIPNWADVEKLIAACDATFVTLAKARSVDANYILNDLWSENRGIEEKYRSWINSAIYTTNKSEVEKLISKSEKELQFYIKVLQQYK